MSTYNPNTKVDATGNEQYDKDNVLTGGLNVDITYIIFRSYFNYCNLHLRYPYISSNSNVMLMIMLCSGSFLDNFFHQ